MDVVVVVWCFGYKESVNQAQVGDDAGGAPEEGGGGVQHRPTVRAHPVRQEQHTGPHQLPQQQEAPWKSQSLRQVSCSHTFTDKWIIPSVFKGEPNANTACRLVCVRCLPLSRSRLIER